MKTPERLIEVDRNVTGEEIAMSIDQGALAHIMAVLTDLYSDPELAVIREYATNALDAHIEGKVKRPIEVTLPTDLSPFFKVRDFGEGLDARGIREIFSRYGTSTKRASNDAVGMLGLGCKSALTYADQFTLTSSRNGRTIQVMISRDENGAGSMTIVDESATPHGEGEGTEIVVPVKRHNKFESKARDFFKFWAVGTVNVNGKPPTRIEGLWVTPTLLYTSEGDGDVCVMGNVPYPMLADESNGGRYGRTLRNLVAFVEIGAVNFTPSRESLQATKATKETLARVRAEAKAARDASVRKQVAEAATAIEAVALLREGQAIGFEGDALYKGRKVALKLSRAPLSSDGTPSRLSAHDAANAATSATYLTAFDRYQKVKGERSYDLDIARAREAVIFEGFTARELSPTKRDKLAHWAEGEGITLGRDSAGNHGVVMAVDKLNPDERFWLEGATVRDWAEIDAIVLPKSATASGAVNGRPRGSFNVIEQAHLGDGHTRHYGTRGRTATADELGEAIRDGGKVYSFQGNTFEACATVPVRSRAVELGPNDFLVCLQSNRVAKFARDFPEAVTLGEAARANAEAWRKAQNQTDLDALAVQDEAHAGELAKLDPARIRPFDHDFGVAVTLAARDVKAVRAGFGRYNHWVGSGATSDRVSKALARYPLLEMATASYGAGAAIAKHADHVYAYIEAVATGDGRNGKAQNVTV